MRRALLAIALLCLTASVALAVGTVRVSRLGSFGIERVDLDWTSDVTSGTVRQTVALDGYFERLVISPDTATSITLGYDVRLVDANGVDVLTSAGVNQSATAAEHFVFFPATDATITTGTQLYNVGPLQLQVDDASTTPNWGGGRVRVYLRR